MTKFDLIQNFDFTELIKKLLSNRNQRQCKFDEIKNTFATLAGSL